MRQQISLRAAVGKVCNQDCLAWGHAYVARHTEMQWRYPRATQHVVDASDVHVSECGGATKGKSIRPALSPSTMAAPLPHSSGFIHMHV